MVRTQVQFRRDQYEQVKRRAAEQGISMSEFLRRQLDAILGQEAGAGRKERILAALGATEAAQIRAGVSDVAERHDDYLVEAVMGDSDESTR